VANGAADKQNSRPANGNGCSLQQAETTLGGLLQGVPDDERGTERFDAAAVALNRHRMVELRKTEKALLRSLERDPLLKVRVESRFSSLKKAISYCGLCGAEKTSAGVTQSGCRSLNNAIFADGSCGVRQGRRWRWRGACFLGRVRAGE
jgi:hypothetical protein